MTIFQEFATVVCPLETSRVTLTVITRAWGTLSKDAHKRHREETGRDSATDAGTVKQESCQEHP